ncbi:MAG: sugar ABC transporter ATP-binding protein [Verrucomicrobia bacterium]|nr:sugar ABC transporter ATP-binding protein [Verrucomicrobiota bacterium]
MSETLNDGQSLAKRPFTVADAEAPFIEMRGISKRFGGVQALADVSFTVRTAEIHCLAGENGCGKSTLIKILSGVHAPDEGQIVLEGKIHSHLSPSFSQRFGIQIIYQDLSLFPNLSVADNIGFAHHVEMPMRFVNRRATREQAQAVMERLNVSLPPDTLVGTLSIATRQLVAICRALAREQPRLIVMDEPTASLTHEEVTALLATIHELKCQGIATVFVSHRLDEVMTIAERVTVLRDGHNLGTHWVRELDRRRLAELITGHVFESSLKPAFSVKSAPMLEVRGLTREGQYHNIELEVRPGEIVGLIGRLGAGRTELALSLFGMNPPDSGEIWVDGKQVQLRTNQDAIRHKIAYVSEDRLSLGLVMPQTIADNAVVSVLDRLTGPLGLIDETHRTETIKRWIFQELRVKTNNAERPVQQLSGGNQQRVVLAKWLATDPRVLLLDSPTVGVDIGAKAGIFQVVDALAKRGIGILLISDEIEEVLYQSHRILVMRSGAIVGTYDPRRVSEQELREAIYA